MPSDSYRAARLLAQWALGRGDPDARIVGELIEESIADHGEPLLMTNEEAAGHFGDHEALGAPYLQNTVRLFHTWRVHELRRRIDKRLEAARVVDIGDSDGSILKALGKSGVGVNLAPEAIRNIEANGVEACAADCHDLPFEDASFDVVLCFETLEHVEAPAQVLGELARICEPGGRVFLSIPWVRRTRVQPRVPEFSRGSGHIFELARSDFSALLTHTPLRIVDADVFRVVGAPTTLEQRLFLLRHRRDDLLAGTFRGFQFYELQPTA